MVWCFVVVGEPPFTYFFYRQPAVMRMRNRVDSFICGCPGRNLRNPWFRVPARGGAVAAADLIYPVFVLDGVGQRQEIAAMPGVERLSADLLMPVAEECVALGIPVIALFPVIDSSRKSVDGAGGADPDGLIPRTVRALKLRFPDLGVMTDLSLDPYTSHGPGCVVHQSGHVENDAAVAILVGQAIAHAEAGADILGPSDMMDGRVGAIRRALEAEGYSATSIMAYSGKYASAFYGPFRAAVNSTAATVERFSKSTYQMDFANTDEALREVAMDIEEGADMVMVKPGLPYIDVVRRIKDAFGFPTFAYHVSGEYAMLRAAVARGWLDYPSAMLEILLAFKRAGADGILTYCALDAARRLKEIGR